MNKGRRTKGVTAQQSIRYSVAERTALSKAR